MKKILPLALWLLILWACSNEWWETVDIWNSQSGITKKEFVIQTKSLEEFGTQQNILKSWKITSASEISINSQASWRVQSLWVKEWQAVKKWQTLAVLQDNIANYGIQLERAKNSLERAKINYDSTVLTLDKAITDTKTAYDKAKINDEILQKDLQVRLEKAQFDLREASLWNEDSRSNLDIRKLEWDLAKAKSDYEISLQADEVTLNNFRLSIESSYNSLNLVYFDLLNQADEVFWVSDKNRRLNDDYEIYLWAKNTAQKSQAETQIRALLADYEIFKNLDYSSINTDDYSYHLSEIEKRFSSLLSAVDIIKNVLKNSVENTTFPQSRIDGLFQTFSWYWQSVQSINSGFISLKNSINSFTSTYKQNQSSRLQGIELLEKQVEIARRWFESWEVTTQSSYDRLVLDIKNSLENSKIWVETARKNYENALESKTITLRSLQNAIRDAEVSYSEASKNYAKLTITSPIDGVIAEKNIDIWQEISPGTKTFTLVSKSSTQVELFVTSEELKYLEVDDEVEVLYQTSKIPAKIESISQVSTRDFTFKVVVTLLENVNIIGDFVEVSLPIQAQNILFPINILQVIPGNKALVSLYNSWEIQTQEVNLWKVYGNMVEILDFPSDAGEIIITDVKNYNSTDFELKKE